MSAAASTGILTIDLAAIARNWRAVANLVAPAECGAVIKAGAYGLGVDRVIPALAEAGCTTFFAATPHEAIEARALAPSAVIYALDGLVGDAAAAFIRHDVRPVLSSMPEVEDWARACASTSKKFAAALHIDSGLNRLGFSAHDVNILASRPDLLGHIDVTLVISHLACADRPDHPKNQQQRDAFNALAARLPPAPRSLAASDGAMLGPSYHFDLVRAGYALYGGQALAGRIAPVQPVVEAKALIIQTRDLSPGETVGYGATWSASRPTRIAIVAAGYADGFARAASAPNYVPGGVVMIGGQRAPVVGRVSMDLITVDVTDIDPPPQRGDWATLIGDGLSLEEAGENAATIGYEVLTRLGRRFARVYIEN